jgi:arylsulfatase A-like enzyme
LKISDDVTTLAEVLRADGYATALFSRQSIYVSKEGFNQGFDTFRNAPQEKMSQFGLDFVDSAGDQPVFVVLYWLDPHAPYEPTAEHDIFSVEDALSINLSSGGDIPDDWVTHGAVNRGEVVLNDAQYQRLRDLYDGEMRKNDADLQTLWAGLTARGIADESLFIFTSDHGEGFGEHPDNLVWHTLPYGTILRVPLIVRYPRRLPPSRVDKWVRTVDIFPTIIDLAGVRSAPATNGRSLVEALGPTDSPRFNIGTTHFSSGAMFFRDGRYKLIFRRKGAKRPQLFDLKDDPNELNNLASDTVLLAQIEERMRQYLSETTLDIAGSSEGMTAEDLEQLRALGYIE